MGGEGKKLVTKTWLWEIFLQSPILSVGGDAVFSAIIFCSTTEVTLQLDHLYIDCPLCHCNIAKNAAHLVELHKHQSNKRQIVPSGIPRLLCQWRSHWMNGTLPDKPCEGRRWKTKGSKRFCTSVLFETRTHYYSQVLPKQSMQTLKFETAFLAGISSEQHRVFFVYPVKYLHSSQKVWW